MRWPSHPACARACSTQKESVELPCTPCGGRRHAPCAPAGEQVGGAGRPARVRALAAAPFRAQATCRAPREHRRFTNCHSHSNDAGPGACLGGGGWHHALQLSAAAWRAGAAGVARSRCVPAGAALSALGVAVRRAPPQPPTTSPRTPAHPRASAAATLQPMGRATALSSSPRRRGSVAGRTGSHCALRRRRCRLPRRDARRAADAQQRRRAAGGVLVTGRFRYASALTSAPKQRTHHYCARARGPRNWGHVSDAPTRPAPPRQRSAMWLRRRPARWLRLRSRCPARTAPVGHRRRVGGCGAGGKRPRPRCPPRRAPAPAAGVVAWRGAALGNVGSGRQLLSTPTVSASANGAQQVRLCQQVSRPRGPAPGYFPIYAPGTQQVAASTGSCQFCGYNRYAYWTYVYSVTNSGNGFALTLSGLSGSCGADSSFQCGCSGDVIFGDCAGSDECGTNCGSTGPCGSTTAGDLGVASLTGGSTYASSGVSHPWHITTQCGGTPTLTVNSECSSNSGGSFTLSAQTFCPRRAPACVRVPRSRHHSGRVCLQACSPG